MQRKIGKLNHYINIQIKNIFIKKGGEEEKEIIIIRRRIRIRIKIII